MRLVRLGKRRRQGNHNRPIKIIFEHKAASCEVLNKSPRLANSRLFNMISVNNDLPLDQRIRNRSQPNFINNAAQGAMTSSNNSNNNNNNYNNTRELPTYENINEQQHGSSINHDNLRVLTSAENNYEEVRQAMQKENSFYIRNVYGDGEGDMAEEIRTWVGGFSQGNGEGHLLGVV